MHCFLFLRWIKFLKSCFRKGFFHLRNKKNGFAGRVRQVVVLHNNDCMGNGLGRLSTGHLSQVVVL